MAVSTNPENSGTLGTDSPVFNREYWDAIREDYDNES